MHPLTSQVLENDQWGQVGVLPAWSAGPEHAWSDTSAPMVGRWEQRQHRECHRIRETRAEERLVDEGGHGQE